MKNITLLIVALVFGLKSYSQDTDKIKAEIKKNQKEKKQIDQSISDYTKELIKLNELNKSDSIKTILYDFKTKKYLNSNLIPKLGEPIIFKIKNINRLAYNIDIKSKDVAIADVYFNPEIKKALEKDEQTPTKSEVISSAIISNPDIKPKNFSDSKNSPQPSEEDFISNSKKIDNTVIKINKNKVLIAEYDELSKIDTIQSAIELSHENALITLRTKQTEINKKIQTNKSENILEQQSNDLNEEINKINAALAAADSLYKIKITEINTKKTDLESKLSSVKKKSILEADNKKLEGDINNINDEKQKTRTEINETFNKLYTAYKTLSMESQELNNIQSEYLEFRVLALNPLLRSRTQYITQNSSNTFQINIKSHKDKINIFELQLISFYNDYNSAMHNWRILDELNNDSRENVRNRYQTIKFLVDEINRNIDTKGLSNRLSRAIAIDNVLQNDNAYEMSSSPIQPQEDYITFEVEIKNRDDKSHFEYNDERKFVYMEYAQGGIRFDFSSGVVFDFRNQTTNYELTNSGTTNKKIIATSKNDFTPTLAGMFHTSFRRNGIWAFGLTLGASLDVETFQLNSLFPGISLLIGKKQKFIITVGPAFKLVNTLNANYETNVDYDQANFTANSVLTSQQFKIGTFFGLTYNLTNTQKGTFKISDK